jgi:hypothetical protein
MGWQNVLGATGMFKLSAHAKVLLWGFLSALSYWAPGLFLSRQPFLEGVRILEATTSLVGLIAISLATWRAIARPDPDTGDALIIFAFLVELCATVAGFWLLLFRLSGDAGVAPAPEARALWMIDTLWFGFVTGWLPTIASVILVTVPGVLRDNPETGERVPPLLLITAGLVAGAGLLMTLIVLAARPDSRALVEAMRPWVH